MGGYFWRPDRAIVGLYKPKRRHLIARCRRQICSKLRSKRYRNTAANHAEVVLRRAPIYRLAINELVCYRSKLAEAHRHFYKPRIAAKSGPARVEASLSCGLSR